MKKLLMAAIGLMMAVSVNAQYLNTSEPVFYQGKWMIGASASGLDLSWHKGQKWNLNLEAKGGYLLVDDWMITGKFARMVSTLVPVPSSPIRTVLTIFCPKPMWAMPSSSLVTSPLSLRSIMS